VPARLRCRRTDTGGGLEGLLAEAAGPGRWWAMLRKSRRLQPGHRLAILDHAGNETALRLEVEAIDEEGRVLVALGEEGRAGVAMDALVARFHRESGLVPLPPYILKARRERGLPEDDPHDASWYQTTYAGDDGRTSSVAAPTAGLHLTPGLLDDAEERGARTIRVSLEVGAGTFKPVESDRIDDHPMHAERCVVDAAALEAIREAESARRRDEGRIVAVGTTSCRTLETCARDDGAVEPGRGASDLFLRPGSRFRCVDALLTNFHLPESTLVMLVAAFAGHRETLDLYREAIAEQYRFYSFGDAMLLL